MRYVKGKLILMLILVAAITALNGDIFSTFDSILFSTAEARIGRPATPVSYAGVARRSPVGNTPRNAGGPVNRVGRR
jgi:hypothetical protein